MGYGFQHYGKRAGATGIVLAAATAATLALPATASAEEVRLIKGECASTLNGADGKPLTVNLGLLELGTGTVAGLLGTLGLNEDNVVVDSLGQVCDTVTEPVKETVNGTATQLREATKPITEPIEPILPGGDDSGDGGDDPGDDGGSGGDGEPAPTPSPGEDPGEAGTPGSGGAGGGGGALPPVQAGQPIDIPPIQALAPITVPPAAAIPPVAPPTAPDLGQPQPDTGRAPVVTEDSGQAQALPPAESPDRLPMLLAVIALVLVIAGLARSWLRRRAT